MMLARNAVLATALTASLIWGDPASAVARGANRIAVANNSLTLPTDPPKVRLHRVNGASKQDRLAVVIRASGIPLPLTLGLPNLGQVANQIECDLSTDSVHARKSSNFTKIGPKPKTVCPHKVQLIVHQTTLEYFKAGRWLSASPHYLDDDKDLPMHISLEIERRCNGTGITRWASETVSIAIDHGQFYTGTIRSTPRVPACAP